jgi:DNA-binding response OmpR family regulator
MMGALSHLKFGSMPAFPRKQARGLILVIKKILVVDDESMIRNFLSTVLTLDGYQVFTSNDGIEAIENIDEYSPDLVITDLAMPFCDGINLTRMLRTTLKYRAMPVLMLSGADSGRLLTAIDVGANAILRKPIHPDLLLKCVRLWVGEPKIDQALACYAH